MDSNLSPDEQNASLTSDSKQVVSDSQEDAYLSLLQLAQQHQLSQETKEEKESLEEKKVNSDIVVRAQQIMELEKQRIANVTSRQIGSMISCQRIENASFEEIRNSAKITVIIIIITIIIIIINENTQI